MKTMNFIKGVKSRYASLITVSLLTISETSFAHCDTEVGPVIQEARVALDKDDVTSVLKWIPKDKEAEIRTVFAATQTVRVKGDEAKQLADRHFIETLVRLHRAGEGVSFSGIKDEPADPVFALADMALEKGSADELIQKISDQVATVMKQKLDRALEAAKHKDENVESGRKFVAAYVDYTHYVESVNAAVAMQKPDHAELQTDKKAEHSHEH